ncbi:unnamed protein product [Parajaminaea phylloscopi]
MMAAPSDPDIPPSFPLANSAQRQSSSRGALPTPSDGPRQQAPSTTFSVSGPSAPQQPSGRAQALRSVLYGDDDDSQKDGSGSSSTPRSSASLMPPPTTTRLTAPPGVGGASGASLSAGPTAQGTLGASLMATPANSKKRNKVVLTPGHSPLDWAKRKRTIQPPFPFGPIPLSEVKKHKTRESAWTVLQGKVYDFGPYLDFHPGGVEELMRVAGRDGTRLFMLTHSWVNIDSMVDACCIGYVVKDE